MNEVDVIHSIYKTLADFGVKVPIEDQTAVDDLNESVVKFDQTIVLAHHYVKDQKELSKDRLAEVIVKLEKHCSELVSQLTKPPFTDGEMHPADVMVALEEVNVHVQKTEQKTLQAQKI